MSLWGKEWFKQISLTDLYNLPPWLVEDLMTISWRHREVEEMWK